MAEINSPPAPAQVPSRFKFIIFLVLTLCVGLLLIVPRLDYQAFLAQGDHGRDLYGFESTLNGGQPYKDYFWVYGPLMPHYYSLFYKLFGVSITSALLGKYSAIMACGLIVYITLSLLIAPSFAFLGAVWFYLYSQDFFFTYNHVGGLAMILTANCFVFLYLQSPKIRYAFLGLVPILALFLIKLNFGVCTLFCYLVSIFWINRSRGQPFDPSTRKKFLLSVLGIFLLTALLNFLYLYPLPMYVIRQCLPYLGSDHPYHLSILRTSWYFLHSIIFNALYDWPNRAFTALILISTCQILTQLHTSSDEGQKTRIRLVFGILALFYFTHIHEYLVSGVLYRTFWAKPFSIMAIFIILAMATQTMRRAIRLLIFGVISVVICINFVNSQIFLMHIKNPAQYLSLPKAEVYVRNDPQWVFTVTHTTRFLKKHVRDNETFLALPYDPLYYFLADKKSPTRNLIFFNHIKIIPEQERKMIEDMEKNNTNWVLISNRAYSADEGLGVFGKTYCPLLGAYIKENFKEVAMFGDWRNPPGWVTSHGTKILRRK